MADFNTCIQFVLANETFKDSRGNLVTIYEDKETGEISNYGISNFFLNSLENFHGINPKNLSLQQVLYLYETYFWTPNKLSEVTSNLIAQKILDMIVNMGQSFAVKLVQAALNSRNCPSVIDGILGSHTVIEINAAIAQDERAFLEELRVKCISYYKSIATGPRAKNLNTWLARANNIGLEIQKHA